MWLVMGNENGVLYVWLGRVDGSSSMGALCHFRSEDINPSFLEHFDFTILGSSRLEILPLSIVLISCLWHKILCL
jgi:hypothetical protein